VLLELELVEETVEVVDEVVLNVELDDVLELLEVEEVELVLELVEEVLELEEEVEVEVVVIENSQLVLFPESVPSKSSTSF